MDNLMLAEAKEKGNLISKAIKIVELLSNNSFADVDCEIIDGKDEIDSKQAEELKSLIIQARTIVSDRWFQSLK